jgi:2-dehydro-3-deoxyphosphooctonate aldolase (KDO 8-P synthase)
MAGPCVIEDAGETIAAAGRIADVAGRLGLPLVFKASFDKANRTSASSWRGPGLVEGLKVLSEIGSLGMAVMTDIHEPAQAPAVAEVVDIIQIPAFLCRQTDLLVAAGKTGKMVNVKKGQFMAPGQMAQAIDKVRSSGNGGVLVTERGTFFGYGDLVVDFRSLVVLRDLGVPVIYDVTHSVQLPGGEKDRSGGNPRFSAPLAMAAAAVGVDGFFVETHPDPSRAKSDAAVQLPLHRLEDLMSSLLAIHRARVR